eukprot:483657-Amorphochlora_amoeboformis.AAC.1
MNAIASRSIACLLKPISMLSTQDIFTYRFDNERDRSRSIACLLKPISMLSTRDIFMNRFDNERDRKQIDSLFIETNNYAQQTAKME